MTEKQDLSIRKEETRDQTPIYTLTQRAFAPMAFAAGDEQDLINALRDRGALCLSLVATHHGRVIGHLALSPVTHETGAQGWFGLGPISVAPEHQRRGVGGALIAEAKAWMTAHGAQGCVLVGNPTYYARFGFAPAPAHASERDPSAYFQVLLVAGEIPPGRFSFHPAFYA